MNLQPVILRVPRTMGIREVGNPACIWKGWGLWRVCRGSSGHTRPIRGSDSSRPDCGDSMNGGNGWVLGLSAPLDHWTEDGNRRWDWHLCWAFDRRRTRLGRWTEVLDQRLYPRGGHRNGKRSCIGSRLSQGPWVAWVEVWSNMPWRSDRSLWGWWYDPLIAESPWWSQ